MKKETSDEIIEVLENRKSSIIEMRKYWKSLKYKDCMNFEDCYDRTNEADNIDLWYYDSVIENIKSNRYKTLKVLRKTIDEAADHFHKKLMKNVTRDQQGMIKDCDNILITKTISFIDLLIPLDNYIESIRAKEENIAVMI
ncbi:MAG: hypothetical protein ACOWWR_03145 [Eubacteriales bacterium]